MVSALKIPNIWNYKLILLPYDNCNPTALSIGPNVEANSLIRNTCQLLTQQQLEKWLCGLETWRSHCILAVTFNCLRWYCLSSQISPATRAPSQAFLSLVYFIVVGWLYFRRLWQLRALRSCNIEIFIKGKREQDSSTCGVRVCVCVCVCLSVWCVTS